MSFAPSNHQPSEASVASVLAELKRASAFKAEALNADALMRLLLDESIENRVRKIIAEQSSAAPVKSTANAWPIDEATKAYEVYLTEDVDCSAAHVRCVMHRLKRVVEAAGWETVQDIDKQTADAAVQWIRRNTKGRKGHATIGRRTTNQYIQAPKQFVKWLVEEAGRLPFDPLVALKKREVTDAKKRVVRRSLTYEQFLKLYESAFYGPTVEAISGPDRAVLYLAAAFTGFRKSELGSLTKESFDLELARVFLAAKCSKRRKAEVQLLNESTCKILREWMSHKPSGTLLWKISDRHAETRERGGKNRKTHKMIRLDLERVGIPYRNEHGQVDFHALRHTYATMLAREGVAPKVAQELLRHSDINLTMGIYSKVYNPDLQNAVAKLPSFDLDLKPK